MSKKIIVTGGIGYIGSHTVVELINSGKEVIIIDNLSNSQIEMLSGIESITGIKPEFHQIDVCSENDLNKVFELHSGNVGGIIHFAAFKAVGESVDNPLKYYENNLMSLINILKMMNKHQVNNLVFSSSCTVYGQPKKLPVDENAPIQKANSPYGNTKQIAEEIIQDTIASNKELNSIALRYFNPIGAHPSGKIGELPIGPPDNLVPYITQTAAGIRDELKIFGNDYNTPDGYCLRDYLHVVDLAKAHLIALDRMQNKQNKQNFEVFNLGVGKGISVIEVVNTFIESTGQNIKYKVVDRRPGDVEKIYASTDYANKELGWEAKSSLSETLKTAWNWEQNYRNVK